MKPASLSLLLVAFCGQLVSSLRIPHEQSILSPSALSPIPFDHWLVLERQIAFDLLLANIAPSGINVRDAAPGAVLASPSKAHPDYFYQWVRDAAITIGTVVGEYARAPNSTLLEIIELYITMQTHLQHTTNPSGDFITGGLGEPKFEADGSAFWGSWGRVQNDGPALRASTIMAYLKTVNSTSPNLLSSEWLYSLYDSKLPTLSTIKADLEYVANSWQHPGFDLWEEVNGLHFFTAMVQLRAMTDGRDTALGFGDTGAAAWYDIQRQHLEAFVRTFWDGEKGHIVSTLGTERSGLDCALILGSLHGGSDTAYPPWSDEVLISTHKLLQDMKGRHAVNKEASSKGAFAGWGIGRYPEDIYNGDGTSKGNPWFLCTASVSDLLFRSISHFVAQGEIKVNELNQPFFRNVMPDIEIGRIDRNAETFNTTLYALDQWADGFLDVVKTHAANGGHLSEQFDTNEPGFQKGAPDLTWSYGSVVEALERRKLARLALGLK